jgi:hypothetical protein
MKKLAEHIAARNELNFFKQGHTKRRLNSFQSVPVNEENLFLIGTG